MQKLFIFLILATLSLAAQQIPIIDDLNYELSQRFWVVSHDKTIGTPQELEELLIQGADPNHIVDRHNQATLLDKFSCNDKFHEHVKILITHNAQINKQTDEGGPLHHAASKGALKNALALLNAHANVNATTSFYDTPLHLLITSAELATLFEKKSTTEFSFLLQTAQVLIDRGARMDIAKNPNANPPATRVSPLQLAINLDIPELIALFRKKIAAPSFTLLQQAQSIKVLYLSLLPVELLPEISYMLSNEEFIAQQKGRP